MANEVTLNATLAYSDSDGDSDVLQIVNRILSVTTKKITRIKQSIGTAEEALLLGEVTTPGWVFLINRDPTNYVEVRVGTGGAKFARLDPDTNADGTGGFCLLRLGSGAQAPYVIADTSPCVIAGLICST